MGTSSAYGGPGGGTPLIPTWLGPDGGGPAPAPPTPDGDGAPAPQPDGNNLPAPTRPPAPPERPPIPEPPDAGRFTGARNNFSRFASSGGTDRRSLGRAVSNYVSTASGGSRTAAQRMGASRTSGARLFGVLSGAAGGNAREVLRTLNLEHLAGRPIEEVFVGLMDYVCPDGGTIDEGIARDAFIETIGDLATEGIVDFDGLTVDQTQTILELYAAHSIEARLCNDIGTKAITLPGSASEAATVQAQLFDFIRRSVSDALTTARAAAQDMTPERVLGYVTDVYERAFSILSSLGDTEAEAV